MKKLLLLAAMAASMSVAKAETFSDIFKLTYNDKVIENGETVIDTKYYDKVAKDNPEIADIPGYTPAQGYDAEAVIIATNIYDEAMDLAFSVKRIEPSIESVPSITDGIGGIGFFQICYNNLCHNADNHSDMFSLDPEGGHVDFDFHQTHFTELTPVTFQFDFCVMEAGEKLEGTDYTIYLKFSHESDITLGVNGVEIENATETYFNLQGMPVAQPQKGGIYVVRKGNKVSKRVF